MANLHGIYMKLSTNALKVDSKSDIKIKPMLSENIFMNDSSTELTHNKE